MFRRWEQSSDAEERRMVADYYVDGLGSLLAMVEEASTQKK